MSWLSGIAGAIGTALGGPVGGAIASGGAQIIGGMMQNSSAKSQAQDQMAFQADMSNTSYQRAVEDMKAAGINPILAAKVGGASTPSGAAAPVENVVGPAVNSALSTLSTRANIMNTQASTAKSIAETHNIEAQTKQIEAEAEWRKVNANAKTGALTGAAKAAQQVIDVAPTYLKPMTSVVQDILNPGNYSLQNAKDKVNGALNWLKRKADESDGFHSHSAKSLTARDFKGGLLPPRSK